MAELLGIVAIGFVSGVLSGMFGIGGGIITTPAIRLLLDAPALVAVGTPLVAIIPSTVTGAPAYRRAGLADTHAGLTMGLVGSLTAVAGAWLTRRVGGSFVLVATAALILYVAVDMVVQALRPRADGVLTGEEAEVATLVEGGLERRVSDGVTAGPKQQRTGRLTGVGALTGFYSGFLGLGGGFVLVPLLNRWMRFDLKRAIGTSLVTISVLSIPGAVTHWALGNVDLRIAACLVVGVIPGAALGARIAIGSSDRFLRLGFAALLTITGVWLAATELPGLL